MDFYYSKDEVKYFNNIIHNYGIQKKHFRKWLTTTIDKAMISQYKNIDTLPKFVYY